MIYWYAVCKSCGIKQYLGAEIHLGSQTPQESLPGCAAASDILLKFITRHGGHRITTWRPDEFNQAPADLPEEWPYDGIANELLVPSWDQVTPLRESTEERKLQQEAASWKMAYDQLYPAYMDLRIKMEPDLREKENIRVNLCAWMDEHGYGHCGPHTEPIAEAVIITPPPTAIEKLAAGFQAMEEGAL